MPINTRSAANGLALFAPVQNSILRKVDPLRVSEFLNERERYVDEVEEKRKEVPNMSLESFKVSVDRWLLKAMRSFGRFESFDPKVDYGELSSAHIESYTSTLVNKDHNEAVNHSIIRDALKGCIMSMKMSDPEARVLEYVHDIFQRLEIVGYGSSGERNP